MSQEALRQQETYWIRHFWASEFYLDDILGLSGDVSVYLKDLSIVSRICQPFPEFVTEMYLFCKDGEGAADTSLLFVGICL